MIVVWQEARSVTATELEILSCFGVEPRMRDGDIPWSYNDSTYSVEVDGLSVSFAVAPGYQDVRLIVGRGGQRLFELNAVGVADVRVIDTPGVDAVEIIIIQPKEASRRSFRRAVRGLASAARVDGLRRHSLSLVPPYQMTIANALKIYTCTSDTRSSSRVKRVQPKCTLR